jgi:hypothetical protein
MGREELNQVSNKAGDLIAVCSMLEQDCMRLACERP